MRLCGKGCALCGSTTAMQSEQQLSCQLQFGGVRQSPQLLL